MILFKFREQILARVPQVTKYRWILEAVVNRDRYWTGFGFELNMQVRGDADTDWHLGYDYRSVYVSTDWSLGPYHIYYDGPHCGFSLGFLHFNWTNAGCRKCEIDGFGP
jgi:hypothetical protein